MATANQRVTRERARAELLEAVREAGTLAGAAAQLGITERAARWRWQAWGLPPVAEVAGAARRQWRTAEVQAAVAGQLGPRTEAAARAAQAAGHCPYRAALQLLLGEAAAAAVAAAGAPGCSSSRTARPGRPLPVGPSSAVGATTDPSPADQQKLI